MEVIPILLESFHEVLTDELATVLLMASAGAFLIVTVLASLMLACLGE